MHAETVEVEHKTKARRYGSLKCSLSILRQLIFPWAFAALFPLPLLLIVAPAQHADVKCLYLGLASAWLAGEIFRTDGAAASGSTWGEKVLALLVALTLNVSLFIALGLSVGVQSNIPFPLMVTLSTAPAMGVMPWLSQRVPQPAAAIVLGVTMVTLAKLAACVVARVVYGPDYIEQGYVAADWRTAKLMITLFWTLTLAFSATLLWASFRRTARQDGHDVPSESSESV